MAQHTTGLSVSVSQEYKADNSTPMYLLGLCPYLLSPSDRYHPFPYHHHSKCLERLPGVDYELSPHCKMEPLHKMLGDVAEIKHKDKNPIDVYMQTSITYTFI